MIEKKQKRRAGERARARQRESREVQLMVQRCVLRAWRGRAAGAAEKRKDARADGVGADAAGGGPRAVLLSLDDAACGVEVPSQLAERWASALDQLRTDHALALERTRHRELAALRVEYCGPRIF